MTKSSIDWLGGIETDPLEEVKLDFALEIEQAMKAAGFKRKEFAARLHSSPAWITKVLRGDANLTLATMQQLADALDCRLHVHIAPRHVIGVWSEVCMTGGGVQGYLASTPGQETLQVDSASKSLVVGGYTKNSFQPFATN